MYLSNLMRDMPTGEYIRRRCPNFTMERGRTFGTTAEEWLNWTAHAEKLNIKHAGNSAREKRVSCRRLPVDGYVAGEKPIIFSFLGCYFHSHRCAQTPQRYADEIQDLENRFQTETTLVYLKALEYDVRYIWECEWQSMKKDSQEIRSYLKTLPGLPDNRRTISESTILKEVRSGKLFGMIQVDCHVPKDKQKLCSDMQLIIKSCQTSRDDIGSHMKKHTEKYGLLKKPTKMLLCSHFGEKILLGTPLLKWLMEKGVVVDKVYQIIQYNPCKVFTSFGNHIMDARRSGDVGSASEKTIGDTCKLIGKYAKT